MKFEFILYAIALVLILGALNYNVDSREDTYKKCIDTGYSMAYCVKTIQ